MCSCFRLSSATRTSAAVAATAWPTEASAAAGPAAAPLLPLPPAPGGWHCPVLRSLAVGPAACPNAVRACAASCWGSELGPPAPLPPLERSSSSSLLLMVRSTTIEAAGDCALAATAAATGGASPASLLSRGFLLLPLPGPAASIFLSKASSAADPGWVVLGRLLGRGELPAGFDGAAAAVAAAGAAVAGVAAASACPGAICLKFGVHKDPLLLQVSEGTRDLGGSGKRRRAPDFPRTQTRSCDIRMPGSANQRNRKIIPCKQGTGGFLVVCKAHKAAYAASLSTTIIDRVKKAVSACRHGLASTALWRVAFHDVPKQHMTCPRRTWSSVGDSNQYLFSSACTYSVS